LKLRAGAPALAGAIDDIGRAFLDFRVPTSRPEAAWLFAHSSGKPAQAAALSELLQKLGDYYAGRGDSQAAFPRYSSAWMLDPWNTEAAVYSAALLRDHPQLDPHGSIRHQLNSTYRRYSEGEHAGFDAQDYENLAGLFAILGSVEAQSQRGASGAIDKFRRGLELEKRDGDDPTPELHLGMAEAYESTGQYPQAFEQYRRAMEGFARDHNAEKAQQVWERAVKLIPKLKGNRQEHQAQLDRALAGR
jgi:tetratricopeptide (TPR) repeat protein